MKGVYFFCLIFLVFSCKPSVYEGRGIIEIKNGRDELVEVEYVTEKLDAKKFFEIVEEANFQSKLKCNYPRTYIPKRVEITLDEETELEFMVRFEYIAENGYGVESISHDYFRFSSEGEFIE